MLALVLCLLLIAILFGVSTAVHLLWIVAVIALGLWLLGFVFRPRGGRCWYW
ncbi:MAG TPA: hydrophobic protein [Verrucomicrobiae bacterium]|nr:hydrophobic protein [Verrucomicrobiae bacterium]